MWPNFRSSRVSAPQVPRWGDTPVTDPDGLFPPATRPGDTRPFLTLQPAGFSIPESDPHIVGPAAAQLSPPVARPGDTHLCRTLQPAGSSIAESDLYIAGPPTARLFPPAARPGDTRPCRGLRPAGASVAQSDPHIAGAQVAIAGLDPKRSLEPAPRNAAQPTTALRLAALLLTLTFAAPASADWVFFRSGPLEVWTDGDHNAARRALANFEQVRWWTAKALGKTEITPLWPVRIVVMKKPAPKSRTPRLELRRDSYAAGMAAADPVPRQWLSDFIHILLAEDARPMPAATHNAFARMISAMEVKASRTTLGKPEGNLDRDWARMHLLLVNPTYAGRSRVFFYNLQQGAPVDVCYRNAFEKTEKEFEAEVDAYFAAGKFEPRETSGKPLNPERDYRERTGDPTRARILVADLSADRGEYRAVINAGEKNSDAFEGMGMFDEAIQNGSESARAWLRYAVAEKDVEKARPALRRAMALNPRWAEPHARWADRETAPERKVPPLKRATELDPHNLVYWQALAEAQTAAKDFNGAQQSWRQAERAAPTEEVRVTIERRRLEYEKNRMDLEAAERHRREEEKRKELEKLKQEAEANVRAAEAKANAGNAPLDPNRKVVEWWDGPKPASTTSGALERIDCGRGPAKWIVREAGKLKTFTVPDPSKVAILGAAEVTLGCGPQKPPRKVKIEAGAAGEILTVEFQ